MPPDYALSGEADADIEAIARDSIRQWGVPRAKAYVLALHETFQRLADFPDLGRDAGHIRRGYWRFETGSHLVFYQRRESGVLIVRVLHQRMDVAGRL